jgi:hypothetical protein
MDTPVVILGVLNTSKVKVYFTEEDLSDFGKLHTFLDDVSVYQNDITEAGIAYLKRVGLVRIAAELETRGGFPELGHVSAQEIYGFLTSLKPNQARQIMTSHPRVADPAERGEVVRKPCDVCGHEFGPHALIANPDQKPLLRRGFMFCPVEGCDCLRPWHVNTGAGT